MGLFDNAWGSGPEFRAPSAFRVPAEVGRFMATPLIRGVFGNPLDSRAIARRVDEMHLHEAELGAQAIEYGYEKGDDRLRHIGSAMIASAVIKAESSEHVPGEVAKRVVDIALDNNVDPATNPLINDESAIKVSEIIEKHS